MKQYEPPVVEVVLFTLQDTVFQSQGSQNPDPGWGPVIK